MSKKFYPPRFDYVFKRIFGDKKNAGILTAFLTAALGLLTTKAPRHRPPMGPPSSGTGTPRTEAGGGGVCLAEGLWNSPPQQTRAAGLRRRTLQASERQAYFAAPRF